MSQYPSDIYPEPKADVNTLANLGPLHALAGIWRGTRGLDIKPEADQVKAYHDQLGHRDSNTLRKIAEPTPNPLARA